MKKSWGSLFCYRKFRYKTGLQFANIAVTKLVFVVSSPVSEGHAKNIYHHAPNSGASVLQNHFMKNLFKGHLLVILLIRFIK